MNDKLDDTYKYHKQNEYPGERVAERKRVAERAEEADKKADERIAEKGKLNARILDSQRERNESKARRIHRSTNTTYTLGIVIIAGLFLLLLVVGSYAILNTRNQVNEINDLNVRISQLRNENSQLNAENTKLLGVIDEKDPLLPYADPIVWVSPANNEINVVSGAEIIVVFDKDMDSASINTNTFVVEQRLTPESGMFMSQTINGTIRYNTNNRQATFTPLDGLHANQVYGDVFTATLTKGIKDVDGNPLKNEYKWSFTTSRYGFNTGSTTSQTN